MSQPFRLPRFRSLFAGRAAVVPEETTPYPGYTTTEPEMRGGQTFRALRHRNYKLYFWGQAISLSGTWMQTVAQSALVLQLTDSKIALGVVVMLQFLPITLFVLPAGVLADRVSKRNLIIGTRLLAMAQSVVMTVLVATGHIELWQVYVLALVLGLSTALEQPARQAFSVELVGREDLLNAVALNTGLFNAARVIGPSIAGVMIAVVGLEVAFFINAISFIPSIWALFAMDMTKVHGAEGKRDGPGNAFKELGEGISYALKTPAVFLIIIIAFFIGLFGFNFLVMVPLDAKYVLGGGPVLLGFLWAALGIGAVVAALVIAGRRTFRRRTIFIGGTAFSVLLGAVALSDIIPLTIVLLLALGVALTAFTATANTALQLSTPDHLRGRVMGLWMLLFAGSTPFGGYLTGFLAEKLSVQAAIGFNAVLCLFGLGVAGLYYVTHRKQIESADEAPKVVVAEPAT